MSRLIVCDGDNPIYGITLEYMAHIRILMACSITFDRAMQFLKRTYEANKALAERPINLHDNVYNGKTSNATCIHDCNHIPDNPSGIH